MKLDKLRTALGIVLAMALVAPVTVSAMKATGGGNAAATTDQRYLTGELVSKDAQRLVTTVGTYDIGFGVTIDDRRTQNGTSANDGARPRIDLILDGDRLRRATIY